MECLTHASASRHAESILWIYLAKLLLKHFIEGAWLGNSSGRSRMKHISFVSHVRDESLELVRPIIVAKSRNLMGGGGASAIFLVPLR